MISELPYLGCTATRSNSRKSHPRVAVLSRDQGSVAERFEDSGSDFVDRAHAANGPVFGSIVRL